MSVFIYVYLWKGMGTVLYMGTDIWVLTRTRSCNFVAILSENSGARRYGCDGTGLDNNCEVYSSSEVTVNK